ncbi:MAG TPA: hypothetical protein VGQ62_06330, partial [Chloroflexota bacterium]|nr:hypothetical protein [Chloroflexota bacterium]
RFRRRRSWVRAASALFGGRWRHSRVTPAGAAPDWLDRRRPRRRAERRQSTGGQRHHPDRAHAASRPEPKATILPAPNANVTEPNAANRAEPNAIILAEPNAANRPQPHAGILAEPKAIIERCAKSPRGDEAPGHRSAAP